MGGGGGERAVTLLTFRDIPWNAPYYARLGFVPLADAALPVGIARAARGRRAGGLPMVARMAMRLDVGER